MEQGAKACDEAKVSVSKICLMFCTWIKVIQVPVMSGGMQASSADLQVYAGTVYKSSAPKATNLFFPKIMSAQDCEHEYIQLKHTEQHLDKI